MMSESDDTDVLLLIPPDLFLVPTSDSDESDFHERRKYGPGGPGVVSELVGHLQSLETRISAIESKDTSLEASFLNNSFDSQNRTSYCSPFKSMLPLSRNKFSSVSQISSPQNASVKPRQTASVPSTPSGQYSSLCTNQSRHDMKQSTPAKHRHRYDAKLLQSSLAKSDTKTINTNPHPRNKHDELTSFSEPAFVCSSTRNSKRERQLENNNVDSAASLLSADATHKPPGRHPSESHRPVREMELSEVDELLHEMESTERELARRINSSTVFQLPAQSASIKMLREREADRRNASPARKLNFQSCASEMQAQNSSFSLFTDRNIENIADISLPFDEDSLQLDETDKMISDFKTWQQSTSQALPRNAEQVNEKLKFRELPDTEPEIGAEADRKSSNVEVQESAMSVEGNFNVAQGRTSELAKSHVSMHSMQSEAAASQLPQISRNYHSTSNLQSTVNEMHAMPAFNVTSKTTSHAATNTEPCARKSQRLFTLSDFWENNSSKSQEEMLRIKLEEEKFRRDHCEHLIQELQKRLLEQQEKVAVAVRVDNEKNVVISQFQNAWTKLKSRWQVLEIERRDLQTTLNDISEKHRTEVAEFQLQIKRYEGELSKALDLAAGYKDKSDAMVKEKLDLLKSHADELENYKSLVQEAENRYSQLKGDYGRIVEKDQQLEEALKNAQQELNRERLRGSEVRGEMALIHKALDACEAELTVLRQEKENMQLKLKEELNRNSILEQNKSSFLAAIEEARKAEKVAKDGAKSLLDQQETMRTELREVYQKQVDEVVKAKLQEFQAQLDAAETAFQAELESRQRAIAECAARKIKNVLDKHQLEINLLEEKHREEKRLCGIQLAQSVQQNSMLESQLNTQQAAKTQLAEQLHSVMQKQWQQALHIISGGNTENMTPIQRINAEKFIDARDFRKLTTTVNTCSKVHMEPMRLESQSMPALNTRSFPPSRSQADQDESLVTMTSPDETPLTSRKDQSKDDLRRYIKMILDMQQPKPEFTRRNFVENSPSPTPICREVPRKHYTRKEESFNSEDSIVWQPTSEVPDQDITEYTAVPQKLTVKGDQHKSKPPWK